MDIKPSPDHREMIVENFIDELFLPRIALEAKSILEGNDLALLRDFPKAESLSWKDKQYLVIGRDHERINLEWVAPSPKKINEDDKKKSTENEWQLPILNDKHFRSAHSEAFEILNI